MSDESMVEESDPYDDEQMAEVLRRLEEEHTFVMETSQMRYDFIKSKMARGTSEAADAVYNDAKMRYTSHRTFWRHIRMYLNDLADEQLQALLEEVEGAE